MTSRPTKIEFLLGVDVEPVPEVIEGDLLVIFGIGSGNDVSLEPISSLRVVNGNLTVKIEASELHADVLPSLQEVNGDIVISGSVKKLPCAFPSMERCENLRFETKYLENFFGFPVLASVQVLDLRQTTSLILGEGFDVLDDAVEILLPLKWIETLNDDKFFGFGPNARLQMKFEDGSKAVILPLTNAEDVDRFCAEGYDGLVGDMVGVVTVVFRGTMEMEHIPLMERATCKLKTVSGNLQVLSFSGCYIVGAFPCLTHVRSLPEEIRDAGGGEGLGFTGQIDFGREPLYRVIGFYSLVDCNGVKYGRDEDRLELRPNLAGYWSESAIYRIQTRREVDEMGAQCPPLPERADHKITIIIFPYDEELSPEDHAAVVAATNTLKRCNGSLQLCGGVRKLTGVFESLTHLTFDECEDEGAFEMSIEFWIRSKALAELSGFCNLAADLTLRFEDDEVNPEIVISGFNKVSISVMKGHNERMVLPPHFSSGDTLPDNMCFGGIQGGTMPYWMLDHYEFNMETEDCWQDSAMFEIEAPCIQAWVSCSWYLVFIIVLPFVAPLSPFAGPILVALFTALLVLEPTVFGVFQAEWPDIETTTDLRWQSDGACAPGFTVTSLPGGIKVNKPHPNAMSVLSILIQALQLASFSFNPTFPWPESTSSTMTVFTRLPLSSDRNAFFVAFFFAVIFVIAMCLMLYQAQFEASMLSLLTSLVPLLFIPVMSGLYDGLVCTYDESDGVATLDADPSINCWETGHIIIVELALFFLAMSHATMVLGIARWQAVTPNLQLTLNQRSIIVETELKFLLVALTSWFSGEGREWVHVAANLGICATLIIVVAVFRPAGSGRVWFDVYRIAMYSWALVASVGSAIVVYGNLSPAGQWGVFGGVIGAWLVIALVTAGVVRTIVAGKSEENQV